MHRPVLRQIESLGYATSVHRMGAYAELHAVKLPEGQPVHIARIEHDGPDEVYRAACELAGMVGIDLEG